MRLRAVLALCVGCTLLAPAASAADGREQSRAEFRRGVELAKSGDFGRAREAFEAAYGLYPHPSILLNLGIARLKTGDPVGAEQDLSRFLADDGGAPPEEVQSARAALADARARLGALRVKVTPTSARARIDERPVALTPGEATTVRLAVGAHEIVLEADGHEPERATLEIEAGKTATIERSLGAKPGRPSSPDGGAEGSKILGLSIAGGALVFAGVGTFCGLRARSLADDYNTPGNTSFQSAETRSEGTTFRTLADVSFGVAIVGAAVGAYFYFFHDSGKKSALAR